MKINTRATSSLFSGRRGRERVVECLLRQPLVQGNTGLARHLAKVGQVKHYNIDRTVARQGDAENDFLLILAGGVSVQVNGRKVAERLAGNHVGEMGAMDITAVRSATLLAIERTTVLRIAQTAFLATTKKFPDVWQRLAIELTARLRERNQFHEPPHTEPEVFIGSSTEGLKYAERIRDALVRRPVVPRLWSDGLFEASQTFIESLLAAAESADFGVLVISADDQMISRGTTKRAPRDNVIFELGLLMGSVGRKRTFIVAPEKLDLKIPSDLMGVTLLTYRAGNGLRSAKTFRKLNRQLWAAIDRLGPK